MPRLPARKAHTETMTTAHDISFAKLDEPGDIKLPGYAGKAVFMASVSPGSFTNNNPNRHYPGRSEYLAAVCDVMQREYEAIVAAGFTVREVPFTHRPRRAGQSKYGLRVMAARPMLDMLVLAWRLRRGRRAFRKGSVLTTDTNS